MSKDPFDEFKDIEKMFRKAFKDADMSVTGTGYSVTIEKRGNETKVNVRGDVSEEDVEMLKRKYPDAQISVNDEPVDSSGPVEVLDEERPDELEGDEEETPGPDIEVMDDDEMESSELALKRFKEKKKDEE